MSVEVNWPGSRIEQEPQYRLVTDEQIAKWNSKDSGYVELTGDTLDFDTLPTGKWKYVMKYDSDGNMINPVKSSIANTTQDNFLTKYGNIKFILIDTTINDENIPESWIQIFTHNNSNFNYEAGSSSESYHFYRVFKSYEKYDLGDIGTVITQTINDNIAASNIEAEILYLKDNDSSGDEVVTTRMFNSTDEISVENESGDSITNIYNYFHLTYAGYDKNESDSRVYHNVIGTFNLKKDTLEYTTNETFGSDTFKFVINSNESNITTDKLTITGSNGINIVLNIANHAVIVNNPLHITTDGGLAFFDANYSNGPVFACSGLNSSDDTVLQFSAGFNGLSYSEIKYYKIEKRLLFRQYTGIAPLDINIYNSGKHQTFSTCFPEGNSVYSFIGYDPNASQNTPFNTGLYSLYVDDYIYAKKGLYAYLTIDLNGQIYKYSGKMGDQNYVTITPDSVGAAPANHTHTISEISGITPEAVGAVSDTNTITDWNAAIKAGYYNSDFGASNTPNPDDTTVTSYGGHVVVGKYFIEQTVFTDAVKDDSGVISRPDSIYQFIRYGKVITSDGNITYDWGEWYAIQYILPNA